MSWQPIDTAPKSGEKRIIIATIRDGDVVDIDFDATYEEDYESWEIPQPYWFWKSAHGRLEEPTHWIPMPEIPPGEPV